MPFIVKILFIALLFPALATISGAASGTLTILGSLTVKQGATVNMEVGGTVPGAQHDEIKVGGSLTLTTGGVPAGPTLNVSAIGGYVGTTGDVIDLFDFASLTGNFEALNLPFANWQATNLLTLGELIVHPLGSGFAAWLASNSLSGAGGDDDSDSLTNVAEYALGGIPQAGAGSNSVFLLPAPLLLGVAPNTKLSFRFFMPSAPPSDVRYIIQAQNELTGSWTDLATKTGTGAWTGLATVTIGPSASGLTVYTLEDVQVTGSVPKRFIRLKMDILP